MAIDRDAFFFRQLGDEIDRDAERVVETKHFATAERALTAGSHVVEHRADALHARRQRAREALFFGAQCGQNGLAAVADLGVGVPHRSDDAIDELRQEHRSREFPAEANGAADDAPQHIAAAFVRRDHAVADQKRRSARMVAEHAHRGVELVVHFAGVVVSAPLGDRLHDRLEQIDVVIRRRFLENAGDALQSHSRID